MTPTDRTDPTDRAAAANATEVAEAAERRGLLAAAALFFGALIVLIAISIVASGDEGDAPTTATVATSPCAAEDAACRAARSGAERPSIIPRPGSGAEPQQPGDRGGWEQLALLGLIVVSLGSIGTLIIRSSRRTRRAQRDAPPVA